jgi:hypothetical protein
VTPDELATRNGVDDPSLWLAIVGRVFDVTRGDGARHYARGMPYAGFVGRDGTRAFATGRFDADGLVADVDGLSDDDVLGVRRWLEFYRAGGGGDGEAAPERSPETLNPEAREEDGSSGSYREIGVLAGGHYYDANGVETSRKRAFDAAAHRAEKRARDDREREALWRTCARTTRSGASRRITRVPVRPDPVRAVRAVPRGLDSTFPARASVSVPKDAPRSTVYTGPHTTAFAW